MKKTKKDLVVLAVAVPNEFCDLCEACEEANVKIDTALSFELALDKINENQFNMILLSSIVERYVELIAAAKAKNPEVVILGFSDDRTSLELMISDDCDAATSFEKGEDLIEQWLEQLAK